MTRILSCIVVAIWFSGSCHEVAGFVAKHRWMSTANGKTSDIGNAITLTWSVAPDGTSLRDGQQSGLIAFLDNAFGVESTTASIVERPWLPILQQSFDRWSQLGGVRFVFEPYDDGAIFGPESGAVGKRGDIRLAGVDIDGPRGTLATSNFPDGGDITIDTLGGAFLLDPFDNFKRFRNVLMHEIGHSLGLDHVISSDAEFLMEPDLNLTFDGPQIDEIRGLHALNGDRFEGANNLEGNDTIDSAAHLGSLGTGEKFVLGEDAAGIQVVPDAKDFLSISRFADNDYFSFDAYHPSHLNVTLTPLGASYSQGVLGGMENVVHPIASSNLSFNIYDQEGVRLANVDKGLHGFAEKLIDFPIASSGRYFVQVRGTRQTVQLYKLELQLNSVNVSEPSGTLLILSALALLCWLDR